jgi:hypothetical protein
LLVFCSKKKQKNKKIVVWKVSKESHANFPVKHFKIEKNAPELEFFVLFCSLLRAKSEKFAHHNQELLDTSNSRLLLMVPHELLKTAYRVLFKDAA